MEKGEPLILGASEREEISLIARSFGRCILEKIKGDLSDISYSIMLGSSTMVLKNATVLKSDIQKNIQILKKLRELKLKIELSELNIWVTEVQLFQCCRLPKKSCLI